MTDTFYRKFEDEYRGSRELIKFRLRAYLAFLAPLKKLYPVTTAVDLGCGRGEWLELMQEEGIVAQGVDLDPFMLEACVDLQLNSVQSDAVAFLKTLPDNSQAIVSAFHLIEHIPFHTLQELIAEAYRVLLPAGLLILETPNSENLKVGTSSFYLDPSHERPIPPLLLEFLTNYHGFFRSKVVRLQEPADLLNKATLCLNDVFGGVSPDYSVVAQKASNEVTINLFADAFNKHFGLSLESLAERYDSYRDNAYTDMHHRIVEIEKLETRVSEVEKLDLRVSEIEKLETRVSEVEKLDLKLETRVSEVEKLDLRVSEIEKLETRVSEVEKLDLRVSEVEKLIRPIDVQIQEQNRLQIFDKLNDKIHHLQTKLLCSEENVATLFDTIQKIHSAQISSIEHSISWRATKPLRWFASLLPSTVRISLRRFLKFIYWLITPWKLPQRLIEREKLKGAQHQLIYSRRLDTPTDDVITQSNGSPSPNLQDKSMKDQLRKLARSMSVWPIIGRIVRIGIALIRLPETKVSLQAQIHQLKSTSIKESDLHSAITIQNQTIQALQEKFSHQQDLLNRHNTFIALQLPRLARSLAELNQKTNIDSN